MSLNLYQTALVWYAQRGGIAKLWGRQVCLVRSQPPMNMRLAMVEYFPEIGQREIQLSDGPRRFMEPTEIEAADAFLMSLFAVK